MLLSDQHRSSEWWVRVIGPDAPMLFVASKVWERYRVWTKGNAAIRNKDIVACGKEHEVENYID
jgi:hypothetical protein